MADAQLVTLDEALDHLKIDDDASADLRGKLAQAEQTVLTYMERTYEGWTLDTVPLQIKAAILMVLAHLWEHRGDEDQGDPLTPAVRSVLRFFRDPVAV